MGLTTGTLAGVIAGSLAGVIIFSILGIGLYVWRRHRRKERRHSNKQTFSHHHLTPDTSLTKNSGSPNDANIPTQSDPRFDPRLDPRLDLRLPRVGSSNLWFGNPFLYNAVPSQMYQDMKRKSNTTPFQDHSQTSGPHGQMLYQSNFNRIYHSQQVVPNIYQPDYRLARRGSYMEQHLYPINYDPYRDINNTMLLEYPKEEKYLDRYREREVRRTGEKVHRSQSDVTLHFTQRPKHRKQRGGGPFEHDKNSSKLKNNKDNKIVDRFSEKRNGNHSNDKEIKREEEKPTLLPSSKCKEEMHVASAKLSNTIILESAADTAKRKAIQYENERQRPNELAKTQQKEDYSVYISDNFGFISDEFSDSGLHVRPYYYEGKPTKNASSVVAKMAALTDAPNATFVNRQGINNIRIVSPPLNNVFHNEVTKKLEQLQLKNDSTPHSVDSTDGPAATSTINHSRASKQNSSRDRRRSRRGSGVTDQDGNVVTEQAFEFLDGYSDGEWTDYHESGNTTPTHVSEKDFNL